MHASNSTVNIAITLMPSSFLPQQALDVTTVKIIKYITEPLFIFDNELGLTSQLLESWKVSKEKTLYEFVLRKQVLFHDGKELTTDDVIFTLKEALKGKTSTITYIKSIQDIKKVDKYKFKILLSKPSSLLFQALADRKLSIVPDHYRSIKPQEFAKHPIGIGKYILKEHNTNYILLESFAKYHSKQPITKRIKFIVINDKKAYQSFVKKQPLEDLNLLIQYNVISENDIDHSKYKSLNYPLLMTAFIGINHKHKIFEDNNLRAFLFTFFRDNQINKILKGSSFIEATGFVPFGMIGNLTKSEMPKRQTDLKLLYGKLKPKKKYNISLKFYYGAPQTIKDFKKYIGQKLKPFPNIHISINRRPTQDLVKDVKGSHFELIYLRWGGDFPYTYFYLTPFRSGAKENYFNITSTALDNKLDSFSVSSREGEKNFFQEVDKLILSQFLIIPLYYPKPKYYFPKTLKGYKLSITGIQDFDFSNCESIK